MMMSKKIIFFSYNNLLGSDNLRAKQIANSLNLDSDSIITQYIEGTNDRKPILPDIVKKYNNCIFFWIWSIPNMDILLLAKQNNNINIYDCVDNYLYNKNEIDKILDTKLIDTLIVNNNYMKNEIRNNINFLGNIEIIYHHYDIIFEKNILINQNQLTFGYMGSLGSLRHTDNFLNYKKLMFKFPIEFLNTEDGLYYTNDILHNIIINGTHQHNLSDMTINFNCHISIRKLTDNISKYKTTAKIATASFFNHNIITTYEESVKDILPDDYPFLLKTDDFETINKMFELVIDDYNTDKILWNKGLEIMKEVKNKLSLESIMNDYNRLINKYLN